MLDKINNLLKEMEQACKKLDRQISIMEVCGTHTVAIFRNGIRSLLPAGLKLISGPGCPVCVTPGLEVEKAIRLACTPGIVLFCFGDMVRVPGANGSLETARAGRGARVRVMYSPLEALDFAEREPGEKTVMFGIGFETTIPLFASVLRRARERGVRNLFLLPAFKLLPPALEALLARPGIGVDGLMLPGNVSAVIGADAYRFVAERHRVPGVVTGFEAADMLQAILMLLEMIAEGRPRIRNEYARFATDRGNETAAAAIREVFVPRDSQWRGLGMIPASGLGFREEFAPFDAASLLAEDVPPVPEPEGCLCGDVIAGAREPRECALFGSRCTPSSPVGACMVSGEGTCAAHFNYGSRVNTDGHDH
jgi:hydrogenase expression/formation protein HypD